MHRTWPIKDELLRLRNEIEQYALDYGLDFYPVVFEVCDYDTINILAAQGGFPNRYPHWRFGMEYDQLSKGYTYGVQKIYEMVVNTDPCYAYLLRANNLVDQKIVMAHVFGHADFFKHNYWFSGTNRNMMDIMANHGTKIRRYMNKHGQDRVEAFIDRVLSLENLLDINILFDPHMNQSSSQTGERIDERVNKLDGSSEALQSFIRSKERYEKELNSSNNDSPLDEEIEITRVVDTHLPCRDIMGYLMENSPLEEWELDIIGLLREEAYYFLPQRMTKIMNEGWASYWHSTVMTQKALTASEIIDFADRHAGVMQMSKQQLNPYKIGIELFRDIEHRWDTGKFGKEYNECADMNLKSNWNKETMRGREKIFEIRKTHNDITFIDEFFTEDFCERQQLFTYKFNSRSGRFEIDQREFEEIKSKLLAQLTNFGTPIIEIVDSNYENKGELLMKHLHQGIDLDFSLSTETLKNIYFLWKRPVSIDTIVDEIPTIITFNGKEVKTKKY